MDRVGPEGLGKCLCARPASRVDPKLHLGDCLVAPKDLRQLSICSPDGLMLAVAVAIAIEALLLVAARACLDPLPVAALLTPSSPSPSWTGEATEW